jgi:TonB family protein
MNRKPRARRLRTIDVAALAIGFAFGMAGSLVPPASLRANLWNNDVTALVVATGVLAVTSIRRSSLPAVTRSIRIAAAFLLVTSLFVGCVSSKVAPDVVQRSNESITRAESVAVPTTSEDERERLAILFADRPDIAALLTRDCDATRFPRMRISVPPRYPLRSYLAKSRALVKVAFVITEDGSVDEARIFEASDSRFIEPTLAAVRAWKFYPGTCEGKPAKFLWMVPVRFELEK